MSFCHMRIARPVSELETSASMYCAGLGLQELGSFTDHEGFSGIMIRSADASWHLEFTHCRHHPVTPSPGDEDLLVLYYPQRQAWEAQCSAMDAAGFLRVTASTASLSSTATAIAPCCKTAPGAWWAMSRMWRRADDDRGWRQPLQKQLFTFGQTTFPSVTDKTPSRLASLLAARYAKHPYVLTLYPYEHFRQHHAA